MRHLADESPPAGMYAPDDEAVVRYAARSTRMEPIDDELYASLRSHFSERQVIELCLTVGLANMINRFHATFETELDTPTRAAFEENPL